MISNSDFTSENLIEFVIAIPSYNETSALPTLIKSLAPLLTPADLILVLDDSSIEIHNEIRSSINEIVNNSGCNILFSHQNRKSGRGASVRRGMLISREQFPALRYFIECDADGSHQVHDIVDIKNLQITCDLLIGSRYLKESQIIGWPITRRIFSKILNIIIPFLLNIPIKDITNGLRRYTPEAIDQILSKEPINKGFTYLSEQAYLLRQGNLTIAETPITFIERISGKSTVTWKEIADSLKGVFKLALLKNKMR